MIKRSNRWRRIVAGMALAQFLSLPVFAQNQQNDNDQFNDEDEDYVNDFMENENGANNGKNLNQQNNNENNFQENNQNNSAGKKSSKKKNKKDPANINNAGANANFNKAPNGNGNPGLNPAQVEAQNIPNAQIETINPLPPEQGAQAVQTPAENGTFQNAPVNAPLPNNAGEVDETAPATDADVPLPEEASAPPVEADEGPVVPPVGQTNEFAGAPPVFGTRRIMAIGEAPEEYSVEPGDTLYDICDQLVDEPDYWPKLWALNPDIKNPHFIYPGIKLTFYPGDAETPPFLQLVTENDVVPVDQGEIRPEELVERQDISGLLLNFTKNGGTTPIIGANDLTGGDGVETQLVVVGDTIRPDKVTVTVPAFLYESKQDPMGVVVGGVAGSVLTDKNDEIIVSNRTGLNSGTTYTVLRETQTVYDGMRYVGKRYEFVAHVRVAERANGENLYLARVTENRLGVQPGDMLMPYKSTTRIVATASVPLPAGGTGNVILGFENPDMVVGGQGSLALIDTKSSKMSVGQTIAVYQDINRSASPFIKDQLPDVARNVAIVRIIDNTGVGAIGYVLTMRREIRVGDRAGKG